MTDALMLDGLGHRVFADQAGSLRPANVLVMPGGTSAQTFTDRNTAAMTDALMLDGLGHRVFADIGRLDLGNAGGGPWTADDSQKTLIVFVPRASGHLAVPVVPNPWDGT